MSYYMSVDGGGTKLLAVLFDDRLYLCGQGRGGSINPNFEPMEDIEATMRECIRECLEQQENILIDRVYISMPGPSDLFLELLQKFAVVGDYIVLSEGQMSLLAGLQCKRGMVALSGTGSGVFWMDGEDQRHAGGWGSLLGDEGSAYDIGRMGLTAAIRVYEGRGEDTVIGDLVQEKWKLTGMWDMVPKIYGARSARAVIASASPIISEAASMEDKVAIQIFENAGNKMALQALALLNRINVKQPVLITISGGAWKGCRKMLERFEKTVIGKYPQAHIKFPLFEPVMGGVIAEGMNADAKVDGEILNRITNEYRDFLYNHQWKEGGYIC